MTLDPSFLLSDPDLHDGSLEGVMLRDGALELVCRHETGVEWRVRLGSLERLRVRDFREGNIINELFVFKGSNCPDEIVSLAYGLDKAPQQPWFEAVRQQVRKEEWVLLYMHCSYGGDVVALAQGELKVTRG